MFTDLLLPTDRADEIKKYLMAFSSIISNRANYISVPITTGPRFVKWYESEGKYIKDCQDQYNSKHIEKVINPNIKDARKFVSEIRMSYKNSITIEPTSISVLNWKQADYLALWDAVITKYVDKIYFYDGWQYSHGCSFEFYIGSKLKLDLFKKDKTRISIDEGMDLIKKSVDEYKNVPLPSLFLENIIIKLNEVKNGSSKKRICSSR